MDRTTAGSNSARSMSATGLRRVIGGLATAQPLTDAYESATESGEPRTVWYRSQKEHLEGWLERYDGPGAYGRRNPGQDARFFYNHFKCAPGLMWLAEALGENPDRMAEAIAAVRAAGLNLASQCGAFRRVVSWERITELIESSSAGRKRSWLHAFKLRR